MVEVQTQKRTWVFAALLVIVLISNYFAYRLPAIPVPANAKGVVIGSLIDLSIVAPLLILAITRKKGFTLKRFVPFMVLGLIAARFVIPESYFEPFRFLLLLGIGAEILFLLAEIGLLFLLVKQVPQIKSDIEAGQAGGLFAFPNAVKKRVSSHPLISILAAEALMFYYAVASWKQKPIRREDTFTLHEKTSLIAFNIMLIHAIVIETFGLHWWLHEKSMLLSIVLLVLNVYSVFYFLADIQVTRLNPASLAHDRLYLSLGLGKRMEIPYDAIDHIVWGKDAEMVSLKEKGMIDFIARDFEEAKPGCILYFNRPLTATLFLGQEKEFTAVAVRFDEMERFRSSLESKLDIS